MMSQADDNQNLNRRSFLQGIGGIAGAGLLGGFPMVVPARAFGANERVRTGHIGVKNQGTHNLTVLMNNAVAVCDVDKVVLGKASELVEKVKKTKPATYSDYRRLLDSK